MTAISVVAFAVMLHGCGGGGGSSPVATMDDDTPPTTIMGHELETVQADAAIVAAEAATAAEEAKTASDAAQAARQNRAIIQTGDLSGGNSGMLAHSAYMQAKAAADAATDAQTASDAAAAETDVVAAARALVMAENARDNAVTAQGLAETHRDAAVLAAAGEVKVVDKTKTVGDTSITLDGNATKNTLNSVTRNTGLLTTMPITTPGNRDGHGAPVLFDQDATDDDDTATAVTGRTAVTPSIAFTYDSANDDARVTLVHSYLGSQKQMQFVRNGDTSPFDGANGARTVTVPDDDTYPATDGKITLDHDDDSNTAAVTVAPQVAGGDFRAFNALTTAVTKPAAVTRACGSRSCILPMNGSALKCVSQSCTAASKSEMRLQGGPSKCRQIPPGFSVRYWSRKISLIAEKAFDFFLEAYGTKDKATACLAKDRAGLLTFYDFPAEHWKHLRTTNPIESTFLRSGESRETACRGGLRRWSRTRCRSPVGNYAGDSEIFKQVAAAWPLASDHQLLRFDPAILNNVKTKSPLWRRH